MFKKMSFDEVVNYFKNVDGDNFNYCEMEYYAKKYNYWQLSSGKVIEIRKPSISNAMYYNDEMDAPSTSLASFINYNLRINFSGIANDILNWKQACESLKLNGYGSGLWDYDGISFDTGFGTSIVYVYRMDDRNRVSTREKAYTWSRATQDEQDELVKLAEIEKSEYLKRLETYYKKYGNKIYTQGYWANR